MHTRSPTNAGTSPPSTTPKDAASGKKNTKDEVGFQQNAGTLPPTPPGKDPDSGKLNSKDEARGKAPIG
ncbi:hypothetical protein Tco_1388440 [Tanacetum coccineum]